VRRSGGGCQDVASYRAPNPREHGLTYFAVGVSQALERESPYSGRIQLARFGDIHNLSRNDFGYRVLPIGQPKRLEGLLIGNSDFADLLRIERALL
jgi:hypothetical protein